MGAVIGGFPQTAAAQPAGRSLRILCSVFPVYQFTRAVTEGRTDVQVELMLPATLGCPHDYLLTPQDMARIAGAGIFVANGLGLEEFLGAPLQRANPKVSLIDASRGVAKEDLLKTSGGEAEAHGGYNPHLFASPALAARMVMEIARELGKIDPAGAALYQKNAAAEAARLNALAREFKMAVAGLRERRIVTAHGVFDYLAGQSGLEIVAVLEEVPGQEPSAAQMLDLTRRIKSGGAAAIFTEPQYPAGVGQALARETGLPLAVLDPVASGPENAPRDYYETVMRNNIETLKKTIGK